MLPKATPRMLSQQLHSLEECGLIRREVVPPKPPRTLYSLTPFGRSIIPVLDAMCDWARISWTGRALRRAAAQKLPVDLRSYLKRMTPQPAAAGSSSVC